MKNRHIIIAAVAATLLLAVGLYFWGDRVGLNWRGEGAGEPVYCTADAKMCPDGSYVGRIPPSCEFAACPVVPPGDIAYLETHVDRGASGLGVKVTPRAVLEDSRCPLDVVCIQAGTVRVRATLESGLGTAEQIFELNKPVTTEAEVVELVAVSPASHSGVTIVPADYLFTFKVMKRSFSTGEGKG